MTHSKASNSNALFSFAVVTIKMILPIYAYGYPILKKVAGKIDQDYKGLDELIENMWETMYNAKGVGLAAPQIGLSMRLFLVDTAQMMEDDDDEDGIKQVFINAEKIEETGSFWDYEEGCLSIPDITGDISRPKNIRLKYYDEKFNEHIESFDGLTSRVIQHEYDHLEGELFTEKLKPLKKDA